MLELLCTNTYSLKIVSFSKIQKYTIVRSVIYQGLFKQNCILEGFQGSV